MTFSCQNYSLALSNLSTEVRTRSCLFTSPWLDWEAPCVALNRACRGQFASTWGVAISQALPVLELHLP